MTTWNPVDYAHNSSVQHTWARELLGKLHLAGHERVLDIGCGDGKITAEIASAVPHGSALGIDNSSDMIAYAKANHEGGNVCFQIGDASALPFNASFDVIFSNACLHWVYDHKPVLSGIRCALAPAGRALLQMGGQGNAADVMEVVNEMMASPRWVPCFRNFTFRYGFHSPDDYRRWLNEAGLRPVRVELIPKTMHHAGREGLTGWFRSTWHPFINAVPSELQEQFIDQAIAVYLDRRPLTPENEALVAMVRLEVECAAPEVR